MHGRRIQNRTKICKVLPVYTEDEFRTVPKFTWFLLFTPEYEFETNLELKRVNEVLYKPSTQHQVFLDKFLDIALLAHVYNEQVFFQQFPLTSYHFLIYVVRMDKFPLHDSNVRFISFNAGNGI